MLNLLEKVHFLDVRQAVGENKAKKDFLVKDRCFKYHALNLNNLIQHNEITSVSYIQSKSILTLPV